MAVTCGVPFDLCAVRATALDDVGNPSGSGYVSNNQVSISVTPNIEDGPSFSVRNGCGCSIFNIKSANAFQWFDFSFVNATIEPELQAMLLGATLIMDTADAVGHHFGSALECGEGEPTAAFEFWTKHGTGGGLDGNHPYIHWVFPMTIWQLGDNTFQEGPAQPTLTGFSRANANWGIGPYGDGPPDGSSVVEGAWWKTTDSLPQGDCASVGVSTA